MDQSGRPLREAHAHILAHGRSASMLWLSACGSRAEALALIRARAASLDAAGSGAGEWLIAAGARPEGWLEADARDAGRHGAWPTLDELDDAAPGRACLVMSFDHHSGAVNSHALRAAGLDPASRDVDVLARDGSGLFTGVLLERAFSRAREAAPRPDAGAMRRHLVAALADFGAHGFDEVHDLWSPAELGPMLRELESAGALAQRVWMYPLVDDAGTLEAAASARPGVESSRVRLAGGKVFADGTLNAATAWMRSAYRDGLAEHPRGTPLVSVESLRRDMRRCWTLGVGLAIHAIGDAAVGAVLDAAEAELANPAWRCVRDAGLPPVRIEHAEIVDEADTARIVRLWREMGLVLSVQPCHLLYDVEALERRLPHRLHRVLPLRELNELGLTPGEGLWFGSDAPIVRPNPSDSIAAATLRRRGEACVAGPASRSVAREQAIEERIAWACFRPNASMGPDARP